MVFRYNFTDRLTRDGVSAYFLRETKSARWLWSIRTHAPVTGVRSTKAAFLSKLRCKYLSLKRPLLKGSTGTASLSLVDNYKSSLYTPPDTKFMLRKGTKLMLKRCFPSKSILKTYRSAVRLPPLDRLLLYTRLAQNFNAKSSYCRDV